jgi:hypothetical protein
MTVFRVRSNRMAESRSFRVARAHLSDVDVGEIGETHIRPRSDPNELVPLEEIYVDFGEAVDGWLRSFEHRGGRMPSQQRKEVS